MANPGSEREAVDLRILQANERTLLAWIRTGLALMALGFVVARLAVSLRLETQQGHSRDPLEVGVAIVALGAACQVVGAVRFVQARRALLARRPVEPGVVAPVLVALLVAAAGAGLLTYLLLS